MSTIPLALMGTARPRRALMTELRGIRYLRASQDRWGNTVSVDSQDDEGVEFFDENGIIHVGTYSDNNLSGSFFATEDRDSYELALADLKSGKANLLWTWDSARAQRNLGFYTRLRDICTEAGAFWAYGGRIYDMRDPKDRQDTARDAVNAEARADEISMNSRRGVKSRAKKGEHAGPIAYGYRPTYSPETGRSLGWVIVDEEAEVIRRIVDWLLDRKTLTWIARKLNAEGVPCPRDSRWNKRYVARVMDLKRHPAEWAEFLESLTPEERELADMIVARVASGHTPREVGRKLNREGQRHFFPCRWNETKVKNIALSPPSAGLRRHHGEVVLRKEADLDKPGETRLVPVKTSWTGIKTHDEHALLMALLTAPERKTTRDGDRVKYRWSGISQCGVCKSRTTVVLDHGKLRIRCYDKSCVTRDYALVDAWLTEQALLLLEREDAAQVFRIDADVTEARTAQKKAEELRARLDSLRVQTVEGKITAESFGMFETDLLSRIEKENEKAKRATLPPALVDIIGTDVRTVFLQLPVPQQREILRAIMRPKVLPTKRKVRGRLDTDAIDPGFRYSVPVNSPEPAPGAGGDLVAAA